MDSKELAHKQAKAHEMFGLQARQELSVVEVSQICKDYLIALDRLALATQELGATMEALNVAIEQRDSANGKLSALQRKVNKGKVDADAN